MTQRRIDAGEREIRGEWISVEGRVHADERCRRIETLIGEHLQHLGHDASGWDHLYLDPADGRYGALAYPQSDQHGGGPPCLRNLSAEEAREKYAHLLT